MQRILVTGGAGFIGSNFCNINKKNFDVTALDNLFLGDKSNLDKDVRFIEGDACRTEDLNRAASVGGTIAPGGAERLTPEALGKSVGANGSVGFFDYVIHLAGTSSAPMFMGNGFKDGYVNSVESFVTTLEWARKNGVKKFLYASSSSLYGNNPLPLTEDQQVTAINHYAVTKRTYEHCATAGLAGRPGHPDRTDRSVAH
jgi:nucleoside-diphosphate-sugar epimerase